MPLLHGIGLLQRFGYLRRMSTLVFLFASLVLGTKRGVPGFYRLGVGAPLRCPGRVLGGGAHPCRLCGPGGLETRSPQGPLCPSLPCVGCGCFPCGFCTGQVADFSEVVLV